MLRSGLERAGLLPYFHWVLSASAVRRYKPAPEVYQLATKHLRLRRTEILFIGDPRTRAGVELNGRGSRIDILQSG